MTKAQHFAFIAFHFYPTAVFHSPLQGLEGTRKYPRVKPLDGVLFAFFKRNLSLDDHGSVSIRGQKYLKKMYGRDLIVRGQVKPEDDDHKGNEPENEHET